MVNSDPVVGQGRAPNELRTRVGGWSLEGGGEGGGRGDGREGKKGVAKRRRRKKTRRRGGGGEGNGRGCIGG